MLASLSVEEDQVQWTPNGELSASTFCRKQAQGFGHLPTLARFCRSDQLSGIFIPTEEEIQSIEDTTRLRFHVEKASLQCLGETEDQGVTDQSTCLQTFLFSNNGQKQLKSRNLGVGIAGETSYEDLHILYKGLYMAVVENKGGDSGVIPAFAEGAAIASNFALRLLALGLPPEECIVPVVANTGVLMAFGVTIILKPSFPTFVPISKTLDLGDEYERRVAAAYLQRIKAHAMEIGKRIPLNEPLDIKMGLSTINWFIKTLDTRTFQNGLGMFDTRCDRLTPGPGIMHMVEVLNRLHRSEAREFVEFPVSIRSPSGPNSSFQLIYRNLKQDGYMMGAPNRDQHPEVFQAYSRAVTDAVGKIHAAGVIHCDLYVSNIMWRLTPDCSTTVDIKIVDWDGSHCRDELDFAPEARLRLQQYFKELDRDHNVELHIDHDLLYIAVLDRPFQLEEAQLWCDLSSQDKHVVDEAFRNLFTKVLKNV
jgi:hypothetical protein